jgi:acylaminoacyl-peptidase
MLRWLSFVIAAANHYIPTISGVSRFPASFVPHPSASAILRASRRQIAFVDNSNERNNLALHKCFTTKRGTAGGMASLKDVEAYHEMVSAAVDFTSIYLRNGIVTGEIAPEQIDCSRIIMLFWYIVSFEINHRSRFFQLLTSATRSVRDIDTNTRRQFLYNIPLLPSHRSLLSPPIELPTKIKARIPSPSGSKIALLVEEDIVPSTGAAKSSDNKRYMFEIWTNGGHRLANRVVLPAEKHGSVCTDFAWFGGISWSPDESALVYSAEVNKPKTKSFFATPLSTADEVSGGQHVLGVGKSEDWGEKYATTALLGLFCLNVKTGKIAPVENAPGFMSSSKEGGYVLGQPIFSPCGSSVVYTGWDAGAGGEMPRRLGAIYCFHRSCKIYSSPVSELLRQLANPIAGDEQMTPMGDAPFACITPNDRLARSPRFSKPVQGLSNLAYLCNTKGFDTHGGCMALHVIDWDVKKGSVIVDSRTVLVDVVQLPGERGDMIEVLGIRFPGLFLNQLRDDCFSPDGKYIFTTTEWGSVNKIVSISLVDGTVSPINFDLTTSESVNDSACQQFICFADDGSAIVTQAEPNRPTVLGVLLPTFLDDTSERASSQLLADMSAISSTSFSPLEPDSHVKDAIGYKYQLMNIWPVHGDIKVPIGSILLLPEGAGDEKVPLIVVPHGGPHTCMSTSYIPSYGYMCKHGYAILHVNFRGSTGFGQAALESLAGTAGTLDVLDVVAATRSAIDTGFVDSGRVGICGGSHGK